MSKRPKKKKKLRIIRSLLLIAVYAAIIYAFVTIYNILFSIPQVDVMKTKYPVVVFKDTKSPIEITWSEDKPKTWLDIKKLPKRVYGAFIVSEDWEFFNHRGFDYLQIQEAIIEDLKTGSFKRGGSTITQQLAKNLFLESDKNLLRKYKELVVATEMEDNFEKMKILETYLNVVEMGPGIYGLSQAANYYFKKTAYEMTAREAAFVAMLLPSPKRYSVSFRKKELTRYARGTIHNILRKMKAGGFINEEAMNEALETSLSWEKIAPMATSEGFAQEMPLEENVEDNVSPTEVNENPAN